MVPSEQSKKLGKILLVEDSNSIREIIKTLLTREGGFTVEACATGHEAIEKAAVFKPQLFLLDVIMPEIDGPSTLTELRKISALGEVPVIFVTGNTSKQDIKFYIELGAIGVIAKPFNFAGLPVFIKKLWDNFHRSHDKGAFSIAIFK